MFSAPFASPAARSRQVAGTYQQVGLQTAVGTASPHQLVALLFDGFFAAVHRARGAMRASDIASKGAAIGQAVSIVNEGLKAALDMRAGGKLAEDLSALYAYIGMRLTRANLHNDEAALDECLRLMKPLQEAWATIGPGGASPR